MAASRASSFRSLNRLATGNHVRRLHITGPTTFPSPLLTSERPAFNLPRDVAGLRDECQKRQLPTVGAKQELIDRINADELVQTRAFSTAVTRDQKRPAVSEADAFMAIPPSQQTTRHFNTSRSLKAVKDSSTIDFAYFPTFDPDMEAPSPTLSVPLLPQSVLRSGRSESADVAEEVMMPTIVTASADSTHISSPSAMTEAPDDTSVDIELMASKAAEVAAKYTRAAGDAVSDSKGAIRTVWNDFLDDVFGPKPTKV